MEPNIWNWLISGLLSIITTLIAPLFGGMPSLESAVGFATPILNGSYIVFDMVFVFFGGFNLTYVGAYLSTIILIGIARGGVVVWFAVLNTIAKVKSLIPVIG